MDRIEAIRQRLTEKLEPSHLDIIDESHLHVGHAGHGGAGHFQVSIVSAKFTDQTMLARHRMVYAAVDDLMPGEIHALSINAMTVGEHQ